MTFAADETSPAWTANAARAIEIVDLFICIEIGWILGGINFRRGGAVKSRTCQPKNQREFRVPLRL